MRHFSLASFSAAALALGLLISAPSMAQTPATSGTTAPSSKMAPAAKADAKIDINTASKDELMAFKGIGDKYSDKIIAGRPYAKKDQLVSKNVLPEATYKKISAQIIATQPK